MPAAIDPIAFTLRHAPRPAMPAPDNTYVSSPENIALDRPLDRASVISTIRCPRDRNSEASASAGKKWPPVPPAAMTMGLTAGPLMPVHSGHAAGSAPEACPSQERLR